ncbi:MAG TPA: DNA translocase FtsK 4TM domain-containing protein, partial [Thermomicrobiales bacterium]|nr:DNA translocase FtsK 4TM domain-containing protein [Thermomicrobiales bacterium]
MAATRTRSGMANGRPQTSKARKRKSSSGPLVVRWFRSSRDFVHGMMPTVEISDRLRREILGVGLVILALVTSWSLGRGEGDGAIISWWSRTLRDLLGDGAPLVPVFLALTAIRAFANYGQPVLLFRHYIGGTMFAASILGLMSFDGRETAGALGMAIGDLVEGGLGFVASGLVLLAIGIVSVFLLADTDIQTLEQDIRRLLPKRRPKPATVPERSESAPKVAKRPSERKKAPKVEAEPVERIINIPKREARPTDTAVKEPSIAVTEAPAPDVPLPLPDIRLLSYYDQVVPETEELEMKARQIEETLASFKVQARVREINPGPAVTQFALEPGNGVKVRRISELTNDLALSLAAQSVRVEAPIPGQARVGVEIPNREITTVGLREVLESKTFTNGKWKLPLPLGRDVNGRAVVGDLAKMPHLLIAGATGAGKSVCLNGIISTFLMYKRPDELRLLMIDPKMVELTGFNGVPHLVCPVVTEMEKVVGALRMVLKEMNRRYELFKSLGVRNIDGYRKKTVDDPEAETIPYLVVIIDELADLMMTTSDEVETLLARLTQMARATGIHLIIATQRPSVNVLTGLIKANVPARIAFAVSSMIDSRVVLDQPGAERLLGRGDMLYLPGDAAKPVRIQGVFIEEEVAAIVGHWHAVSPVPQYDEEWLDLPTNEVQSEGGGYDDEDDPLMEQALDVVRR